MKKNQKNLTDGLIALSFDVEWASPEVLASVMRLLDERGLSATFFCTHAGIDVGRHERGLHPNFRRQGDTIRRIREKLGSAFEHCGEEELYRHIVKTTHAFAPEAVGVRAHSLYYDSLLIPLYHEAGLQYDSSYALPFTDNLAPIWKEYDMLEFPIYYQDHLDMKMQSTGFSLGQIAFDKPGLKVMNFHPNMIVINAKSHDHYMACKPAYHDYDKLLAMRHPGKGIGTLFMDVLDYLAQRKDTVMPLGEINRRCRSV